MKKITMFLLSLLAVMLMGCNDDLCVKVHHTSEVKGGCNFVFDDGSVVEIRGASCTDSYVVNDSTKWGVKRSSYQTIEQCKDSVIAYKQSLRNLKNIKVPSEVKTVTIGKQVWMAENLNVKTEEGSWCYENKSENCTKYGRLYTWAAAMKLPVDCNKDGCKSWVRHQHQGVCPSGFHIPTKEEWKTLVSSVGGRSVAGKVLKSSSGWNNAGDGSDYYGFSALPAGYNSYRNGRFGNAGNYAYFWSASQSMYYRTDYDDYIVKRPDDAYSIYLYYYYDFASIDFNDKLYGFSVRCLRNN